MIHVGRSIERKRCEERITVGDARGGAGGAEPKKITLSDGDTTTTATTTAITWMCVVACCCCVAAVFESQQRTAGCGCVCGVCVVGVVGPEFDPQHQSQFTSPEYKI